MARRAPVTSRDATNRPDDVVERAYGSSPGPSDVGRAAVYIKCPFCDTWITAYLWSIAGGGKRCTCGAFFNAYGTAYQWRDLVGPVQP